MLSMQAQLESDVRKLTQQIETLHSQIDDLNARSTTEKVSIFHLEPKCSELGVKMMLECVAGRKSSARLRMQLRLNPNRKRSS